MVRELFEMARTKKACIIFFDEIDAIGGVRFDDGAGGDNEVQRTMLELITQLDGFDPRGNIKVMFATNRPSTLDPALMRPGRIDRKIEFSLPDLEGNVLYGVELVHIAAVAEEFGKELTNSVRPLVNDSESLSDVLDADDRCRHARLRRSRQRCPGSGER